MILYKLVDDHGKNLSKYKWVKDKSKPKPKPKKEIKKSQPKKINRKTSWTLTLSKTPNISCVVLVKYKDGTITTAYLNMKKEWKLTTDKHRLFGGDILENIKEWMYILE